MNGMELIRLEELFDDIREQMTEELMKADESDAGIFSDIITNLSEILDDLECYIPEVEK